MKTFIQNSLTGHFLTEDHGWSVDTTQALQFQTEADAITYCIHHKLRNIQLVIRLNGDRLDHDLDLGTAGSKP